MIRLFLLTLSALRLLEVFILSQNVNVIFCALFYNINARNIFCVCMSWEKRFSETRDNFVYFSLDLLKRTLDMCSSIFNKFHCTEALMLPLWRSYSQYSQKFAHFDRSFVNPSCRFSLGIKQSRQSYHVTFYHGDIILN